MENIRMAYKLTAVSTAVALVPTQMIAKHIRCTARNGATRAHSTVADPCESGVFASASNQVLMARVNPVIERTVGFAGDCMLR